MHQATLRMPKDLRRAVAFCAKHDLRNLNQETVHLLKLGIAKWAEDNPDFLDDLNRITAGQEPEDAK